MHVGDGTRTRSAVRAALALLLVACGLAALSGCGGTSSADKVRQREASGGTPAEGTATGTLRIAQPSAPLTLDGSLNSAIVDRNVYASIYDTLLQWHWNGDKHTLAPDLATSWKPVGKATWQLKLRPGVKWQNGDPFTAADVKFTIERALNPKNKSSQASFYSVIKDVRVVDAHTVDIDTDGPQATLPVRLTLFPMVPKKYLTRVGDKAFAAHPIGTGPYRVQDYQPNDHLTVTANGNYWGEKPHFQKVVYDFISSDTSRIQALRSGDVDLVVNLSPDALKTLNGNGLRTASVRVDRGMILYMDTVHGGPLSNVKVRQAINYAIDRQGIVKNLLDGLGRPISSTVVPEFLGYDQSIAPYPYDPQRAKQLLAQAGYPNGFSLTLRHTNGYYPADTLVAQAIAQSLEKVGIKAKDDGSEAGVYFTDFLAQHAKKSAPPTVFLGSWGAPVFDAGVNWRDTLSAGNPVQLWSNPTFSALARKGLATMNDRKRAQIYYKAQRVLYNQAPVGFLWQISDSFGMTDRLQWTPTPDELVNPQDMRLQP